MPSSLPPVLFLSDDRRQCVHVHTLGSRTGAWRWQRLRLLNVRWLPLYVKKQWQFFFSCHRALAFVVPLTDINMHPDSSRCIFSYPSLCAVPQDRARGGGGLLMHLPNLCGFQQQRTPLHTRSFASSQERHRLLMVLTSSPGVTVWCSAHCAVRVEFICQLRLLHPHLPKQPPCLNNSSTLFPFIFAPLKLAVHFSFQQ